VSRDSTWAAWLCSLLSGQQQETALYAAQLAKVTVQFTAKYQVTDCYAGQDGAEEAQRSNDEGQDRLSVIEEESDAVPSGDMHHPILGMKSPYRTFSVQGQSCSCLLMYTRQTVCFSCISNVSHMCHMQLVLSCKALPAVQSPALCNCV